MAAKGPLRGRIRVVPSLVVLVVLALVGSLVVLGEPNRPATATVVRPVVTVPALCSAPTVIDVAAWDADRGLTAIGELLGLPEELVAEAAREVQIVDTEAGTFFVLVRDDELRVAALSPAGLPIVNTEVTPPQTYRAFGLGELAGRPPLVVGGPEGVFVLFGGAGSPVQVFALKPTTLASSFELSVARDAAGPELAAPAARAGGAVVHDGVLFLAGDDGRLVTFDPLADGADRWTERGEGLVGPLLARDGSGVHGVFESDTEGASVELRTFGREGEPRVRPVEASVREVTGVSYATSASAVFAVATGAGDALLRPVGPAPTVTPTAPVTGELLGLVATDAVAARLTTAGGGLDYQVLDRGGAELGTFGAAASTRCTEGPWPDAAAVIAPSSAGSLLHLHDPSAPWDCVVDTNDPALPDLATRCAPGGDWSVDKGSAPARDFTVEIGRALDELEADQVEREAEAEPEEATAAEAIQEELVEAGLEVIETEVDPDAADECAAEEVTAVAAPAIDLAEPVGARSIRVEWTWSGGNCLPGRYLVTSCQLGEGTACVDTDEVEVEANPTSGRSVVEVDARPDRTYRVTVRAAKGEVVSDPSGAVLVTTPAVTPDPPVGVSGSLSGGTWRLAWSSCLAGGDCDQRPDGFVVTVEGCEGDGLGRSSRRFDVSQRGTSFGADGAGFGGADLLGRRVQFRVATTSNERVSEPVAAGRCTTSVRPGRDGPASSVGVTLTGRSRQVTMAALQGGRSLSELFGTTRYDDVRARLVRGDFASSSRTGLLSGSATFEVARCLPSGWAVELTPRASGRDLTDHRTRLTDAVVACDPSVDGDTRISTRVTGSGSGGIDLRVTIPELGQDTANELVDRVTGTATCATAFSGDATYELSGGEMSGDDVRFRMPVPVIFDLRGACRVAPVVRFRGGGSAAPAPRRVDLDRAGQAIVDVVLPAAVTRLERARTASYERQGGLFGIGARPMVVLRHEGSGVPCTRNYGSSLWTFDVRGGGGAGCGRGAHVVAYTEDDLADGRGDLEVEARLDGLARLGSATATTSRTVPVCQLPSGPSQPPCTPEPCEYDDSLPADDPACVEPCPTDPSIPADDPACLDPDPGDPGDPDPGDPGDPDPGDPGDPDPGDPGDPDPGDPGDPGEPDPGDPGDPGTGQSRRSAPPAPDGLAPRSSLPPPP